MSIFLCSCCRPLKLNKVRLKTGWDDDVWWDVHKVLLCFVAVRFSYKSVILTKFLAAFTGTEAHEDFIKWKHFPRYWPFVRGIHRPPVNSPHKGQWRGTLMFSLICAWINVWVNNREAGDLKRHRAHYDDTVMNRMGHSGYGLSSLWEESTSHLSILLIKASQRRTL